MSKYNDTGPPNGETIDLELEMTDAGERNINIDDSPEFMNGGEGATSSNVNNNDPPSITKTSPSRSSSPLESIELAMVNTNAIDGSSPSYDYFRSSIDTIGRPSIDPMIPRGKKGAILDSDNGVVAVNIGEDAAFHCMTIEEAMAAVDLHDIQRGLDSEVAEERLKRHGRNELKGGPKVRWYLILLRHLFAFMTFVLLGAMILSLVVQDWVDAGVIGFIIVVNTLIGFFQELQSERAMEALQKLSGSTCIVIRDGNDNQVEATELVVGDLVLLKEGDTVPADIRLVHVFGLECDEAALTGESVPVGKHTSAITTLETPLGDRLNIAYKSTNVTKGTARGIVMTTGMNTEIGKIAKKLSSSKKGSTKLQKSMNMMGLILVFVAIGSIGLVVLAAYIHGKFSIFPEALQIGVSTAVALIPEGLLPILSLTMSFGVIEMSKKNALVRKMTSLESLGNVNHICSDKTGTLTEGKMSATDIWLSCGDNYNSTGGGIDPTAGSVVDENSTVITGDDVPKSLRVALQVCSLCNMSSLKKIEPNVTGDAMKKRKRLNPFKRRKRRGKKAVHTTEGQWESTGAPTEVALKVLAHKAQITRHSIKQEYPEQLHEFAFDSSIKRMTVVYSSEVDQEGKKRVIVLTKGAPERVLPLCTEYISDRDGSVENINERVSKNAKRQNEQMAKRGLRVLALAYREHIVTSTDEIPDEREDIEQDLVLVGLVGIRDPPRPEVYDAIETCHQAGITVHMCTGDHLLTATAIARDIGILKNDEETRTMVMSAPDFDRLTLEELKEMKQLPLVLARCSPETKVRMVEELHRRKRLVAMTGDGVNDSPAIKSADVGIAMGVNGSDVTKGVADIILTDDNFGSIVNAIREGRRIFASIRKFLVSFLSSNVAEVIVLLISILVGMETPLKSSQILWINMVTGTPISLALTRDKISRTIMDKRYRPPNQPVFSWEIICDLVVYGAINGIFSLGHFIYVLDYEGASAAQARGACFATLTIQLMLTGYACRDTRRPFFLDSFYRNYALHGTILLGLATTCATLYIPFVNDKMMKQAPLPWTSWVIIFVTGQAFLACTEIYKFIKRILVMGWGKVAPKVRTWNARRKGLTLETDK